MTNNQVRVRGLMLSFSMVILAPLITSIVISPEASAGPTMPKAVQVGGLTPTANYHIIQSPTPAPSTSKSPTPAPSTSKSTGPSTTQKATPTPTKTIPVVVPASAWSCNAQQTTTKLVPAPVSKAGVAYGLVTTTTTVQVPCPQPPVITTILTPTTGTTTGITYFYTNGNSIGLYSPPPSAMTGQSAITAVQACSGPIQVIDGAVPVTPIGRGYTYSITTQTTQVGVAGGPQTYTTKTLSSSITWNNCVYPQVTYTKCYTEMINATFSGVDGINTTPRITIPNGGPIIYNGVPSLWSNISVSGAVQSAKNEETIDSGGSWKFTPSTPYLTKFGKVYKPGTNPALAILTSSTYGCNQPLTASANIPLALTSDGHYTINTSAQYVYCYMKVVVGANGLSTAVDSCSSAKTDQNSMTDAFKYCGNTYLGTDPNAGAGLIYNDPNQCTTNSIGGLQPKSPPTCVSNGTCGVIPVINPVANLDPAPSFSCKITQSPTVTSPLGAKVSNGSGIQAISNSQPWTIYWPAATFSSYGNIRNQVITNKQTSLVIWPNSQPFNWSLQPTANAQPIVGYPNLSSSSDTNPAVIPGWGDPATTSSTVQFYKKGTTGDKVTVSQRQWFTAYFPHSQTTMDSNGNYINTTGWIEGNHYCDAVQKQVFQVVGVKAVPGQ